jgi:hypothetical protein
MQTPRSRPSQYHVQHQHQEHKRKQPTLWHAPNKQETLRHHEKLLNQPTGIQFISVLHTGICNTLEYKFLTRESLFIFPCVHHGNMSTEWYTREHELYIREYWIKVNLVLVPTSDSNTRLPHFVSSRVQNLSKYATHAICMTDFPWKSSESR